MAIASVQRTFATQFDIGGIGPTFDVVVEADNAANDTNLLNPLGFSASTDAQKTAQARFTALVQLFMKKSRPVKIKVGANAASQAGNKVTFTFAAEAAGVYGITPATSAITETLGVPPFQSITKTIQPIGADGTVSGSILAEFIAINYGGGALCGATPQLYPGDTALSGQAVIAAAELTATVVA